ncbi:hypothetical protein BDV18DRAFT_115423 [Aspergillus unguis]
MAFRLPPQVPRRRPSYSAPQPSALDIPQALSEVREDETREWVLFSPSQPSTTARTHTTSTERTPRSPRTIGASRLSDFGSLGTNARSGLDQESQADGTLDEPLDEDGTELDSLDDGLHAFRPPSPGPESSSRWDIGPTAQLPAHDGLGSFVASGQEFQNQLWQHERYNPNRRPELAHRRRSSVQRHLDAIADQEHTDADRERWQRIENWRMDQSRALLHEIEKATRKRRNSRRSVSDAETISQSKQSDRTPSGGKVHQEQQSSSAKPAVDGDESFWQRLTRKVIHDLMGIDESLLSVIFGEALPESGHQAGSDETDKIEMDKILNQEPDTATGDEDRWDTKLLQRLARELGILVHQFCEHPGAFTSYLNMTNDIPNQYAGIPLDSLPEEGNQLSTSAAPTANQSNTDSMLSPHFEPTLQDPNREHAAQWGIEDEDLSYHASGSGEPLPESARHQHEKEYWERELDIMMVFRYLRSRFGRRPSNPDVHNTRRASQDASRRAAIIRQHHPLVARAHSRSQAQMRRQSSQYSGPTGVSSPVLRQHIRRPSSSCASQSAKMSAISSRRTLTGSSRNYWDIGGSVDSGSAIAPAPAGIGAWGDV